MDELRRNLSNYLYSSSIIALLVLSCLFSPFTYLFIAVYAGAFVVFVCLIKFFTVALRKFIASESGAVLSERA